MNYFLDAVQAWKASRKKLRKDALFARLSDEQLADILRHFDSGIGYAELRQILEKDYNITLSTDRQLSEFCLSARPFILPARINSAAIGADSIAGKLPQLDEKNVYLLKQAAFEVLSSPQPNESTLATMVGAVLRLQEQSLKGQDLSIKLRRLELLERQTSEVKATATSSRLSDAEKAQRIREIFQKP